MDSIPITRRLPVPGQFWTFNREERNAVAVLVGLLTRPGNLATFTRLLGWRPPDLDDAEVSVEWTFLRDLWNHHSRGDNSLLRTAILDCLQPCNRPMLETCTILEFNTHFGAVPRPSAVYIQSPSNWSVARFDRTIGDSDSHEFKRTCKFKWAFNIKPDLVIQTPTGHVLCVEAKWDSREGSYPASDVEKAIFKHRGIDHVSQTEVQQHLVNDVLGFTGTFAYLARTHVTTDAGTCITWAQLLGELDRSETPRFIQQWCEQEVEHRAIAGTGRG